MTALSMGRHGATGRANQNMKAVMPDAASAPIRRRRAVSQPNATTTKNGILTARTAPRSVFPLFAEQMQDDVAVVAARPMLDDVDGLPGAQRQNAVGHRHRQ